MERLVEDAEAALGQLTEGRCYCLKIPAVMGGGYRAENFGTISREEVISAAGSLARQIDHLPDGTKIKLQVVD